MGVAVFTKDEEFAYDDATGFETDEHNNLVVSCPDQGVVFAEGKWERVEIGAES